jgi:hypothetical protein
VKENLKTSGKLVYVSFLITTVWALVSGFYYAFSVFAPYDDEGYLMMTVKQFLNGEVLYDEVYTQYGPAYYFYKYLLVGVMGLPLTHDVTRLTTLVIWTLTAGVSGLLVYRITRSNLSSVTAYLLCFFVLSRTVAEPGHPQDICGLLTAACLFLFSYAANSIRVNFALCGMAALVAVILLIKVNLGLFLGSALGITIICSIDLGKYQHACFIALGVIAILLPFALMYRHFDTGWLRFCLVYSGGMAAAIIIGLRSQNKTLSFRTILLMTIVFAVSISSIVGSQLILGTSMHSLIDGLFLQHLKFADDFIQTPPLHFLSIPWAFIGIFCSIIVAIFRVQIPNSLTCVVKAAFGLAVVCSSLAEASSYLGTFLLLNFATPFLWLLLLPNANTDHRDNYDLPVRLALVFMGLILTLQIFPITGTHMSYGTVTMSVIGTICLYDGLKALQPFYEHSKLVPFAASIFTWAALIVISLGWSVLSFNKYHAAVALALPGAQRIHLPENEANTFRDLVSRINEKCDTFVTMPGLYSFYFWTGKDSPTMLNATAWMSLLDDAKQQTVVHDIESIPRLCAIYHPQLTRNGSLNRDLSNSPLATYIFQELVTESTYGEYQFMVRK